MSNTDFCSESLIVLDYVVISNIIGDDLYLPNGEQKLGLLGGAGTYAAAGIRLWSDHVGIVSGVGSDFETRYGGWFQQNQIDTQGLIIRDTYTPRSWVTYETEDARTETPQFGQDHFLQMEVNMLDIPEPYHEAHGLYIFRDENSKFWDGVFAYQKQYRPTIIWEIHAHAADTRNWGQVAEILSEIDLFSINLSEAQALCQLTDPNAIVDKLRMTGVTGIAIRLGSRGTLVADSFQVSHIPPYAPVQVVDVTGAGNAFTGGMLVGYCENDGDIVTAGRCGTVSASFMLEQFGPIHHIAPVVHKTATMRFESLIPRLLTSGDAIFGESY